MKRKTFDPDAKPGPVLRLQDWLRKRGLPYIHGCIWDRECRDCGAGPVVYFFCAHHAWQVTLPLYYPAHYWPEDREFIEMRWQWHRFRVDHIPPREMPHEKR